MSVWGRLTPKSARDARVWLVGLGLLAALLTLHGIWTDWRVAPGTEALVPWVLKRKLLTINEGLTIVIALGAVLIAHRQFVYAARPYLHWTTVETDLQQGMWRAILKNAGTGLAVIRSAAYAVNFESPGGRLDGTYEEILDELSRRGVSLDADFKLVRFSDGSTLAGGDQVVALEAAVDRLSGIDGIDIRFTYEGVLGDSFEMHARLLPQRKINNFRRPVVVLN